MNSKDVAVARHYCKFRHNSDGRTVVSQNLHLADEDGKRHHGIDDWAELAVKAVVLRSARFCLQRASLFEPLAIAMASVNIIPIELPLFISDALLIDFTPRETTCVGVNVDRRN